jgi:single-strand DNA-binding protein
VISTMPKPKPDREEPDVVNQVTLRGRVTAEPTERTLPSGAVIVAARLSMTRDRTAMTAGSKTSSDWVDCVAWAGRVRRSMRSWQRGDTVEVSGALRRRFFRTVTGPASIVEIEALGVSRVRRATEPAPGAADEGA